MEYRREFLSGTYMNPTKKIIGKVKGDTIYDDYGNIKAYIQNGYIVNSLLYAKILYTLHENGDITEGTSREIVSSVHKDGYITEGTSRNIVERVDAPIIPVPVRGSSGSGFFLVSAMFAV